MAEWYKPWAGDVKTWGVQRAHSWWLQHHLPEIVDKAGQDTPSRALRAVLDVHRPKRLGQSVGCAAQCSACSTGITTHHDDGSFTHRVSWPCPTVLAIAEAFGVGPDDRGPCPTCGHLTGHYATCSDGWRALAEQAGGVSGG